jgi:hypothetical protein
MRYLFVLSLVFILFSCKSDAPDGELTAPETSAPAPGVTPTPAISGSESMKPGELVDFSQVDVACSCRLKLDSAEGEDDLFFAFNLENGPGVISLNGERQVVQRGASLSSGGGNDSYLHQNDRYRIQTSLTDEGGTEQSGRVKITDSQTGEKTIVRVVGNCQC